MNFLNSLLQKTDKHAAVGNLHSRSHLRDVRNGSRICNRWDIDYGVSEFPNGDYLSVSSFNKSI